jgi:iron(III) transport system substrate-binding protein
MKDTMMKKPRLARRLAVLVAATVAFTACGSDNDSTSDTTTGDTAATEAAGSITVYSGRSEELVAPIIEDFTAATGIDVELRAGDSGEMAALLLTEGDASPADVFFSQDAGALGAVEDAGLFAPLPDATLDLVDPAYRSTQGNWIATSGRMRVLVYNPDLVADADLPATIDDLLDAAWKGKIGFAPTNASWQSFVTALRVLRGDDGARTWLEGFAANEPVAYEKNGVVRDAVNSGEVSVGLVNHYYLYEKILAEGADAVVAKNHYFKNQDPGSLVNVAGVGILASSDNAAAARALVDFLLSAEGQTYFAEKTFEYPVASGVAPFADLPTIEEVNPPAIDLADLKSIEATQELLSSVGLLTK